MDSIKITLNNKEIEIPYNTSIEQIAKDNKDVCSNKIIGAKIGNELVSLNKRITKETNITLIDVSDIDAYKMNQAGITFVFEVALKNRFGKNVEVTYDNSMGNGIHATIIGLDNIDEGLLKILKSDMEDIISRNEEIKRINVTRDEAINYYLNTNNKEKGYNIHNIVNNIVSLYKLENYINYFYVDLPISTAYLDSFELAVIDNDEIVIIFPTNNTFNLVEYKKYDKITQVFKDGRSWLKNYDLEYIYNINSVVSHGQVKDLIHLCETNFDNEIHNAAVEVIEHKAKYLLVAGPSSSGKTTTAKKLSLNIAALGYTPLLISTDDYFLNVEDTPKKENGEYDFESIDAVDIGKLNDDLNRLIRGESVKLPKFNFKTGKREYSNDAVKLSDKGIIVMEGIHCLNEKLTPNLDKDLIYRVYLSPFIPLRVDKHNYISTSDLRLIRRIIRDNNNRGTTPSQTLESWQSVRLGEEKYIFPYIGKANLIINTSLSYELGVLKVFVEPLLYSVNNDSPYLEEARRLIFFLNNIFAIPSEYVESDSIIREFIGGSSFKREGDI